MADCQRTPRKYGRTAPWNRRSFLDLGDGVTTKRAVRSWSEHQRGRDDRAPAPSSATPEPEGCVGLAGPGENKHRPRPKYDRERKAEQKAAHGVAPTGQQAA